MDSNDVMSLIRGISGDKIEELATVSIISDSGEVDMEYRYDEIIILAKNGDDMKVYTRASGAFFRYSVKELLDIIEKTQKDHSEKFESVLRAVMRLGGDNDD